MRLLLDTHVVLWQLAGSLRLGPEAGRAIDRADELLVSVVSFVEIGVKAAIGKLEVPAELERAVRDAGVRILPLTAADALAPASMPLHHRDPFDRLLVAQATNHDAVLVSADARLGAYAVRLLDPAA